MDRIETALRENIVGQNNKYAMNKKDVLPYHKSKVSNHFSQKVLNCLYVSFLIAISFSTSRYCFTKVCHPPIVKLLSFSLQVYI